MSNVYLLTYHMTVICRNPDETLTNASLGRLGVSATPVRCYLDGTSELSFDADQRKSVFSSDYYKVKPGQGGRTIFLERAGRYLRSWPSGQVDCHAFDAAGWEEYLLINQAQLDALIYLCSNAWVDTIDKSLIDANQIQTLEDFRISCGRRISSYRQFDPITLDEDQVEIMFYYDEWKVDRLTLLRPLVYYVAFGSKNYLKMAFISMESWAYFNKVQTKFLIMTNRSEEEVLHDAPELLRGQIVVWTLSADEFFDFAMQRFRIAEWESSLIYQPLIYLDTDVVCDAPLDEILADMVTSSSIMVANEPGSPRESSESVGSTLIAQDECSFAGGLGFNSGTLGIPNARRHKGELRAIAEVMLRYAESTPGSRLALHWFDQSCANYVSAKIGNFEGERLGGAMTFVGHGQKITEAPRGLAHFWGGHAKAATMSKYLTVQRGVPLFQGAHVSEVAP